MLKIIRTGFSALDPTAITNRVQNLINEKKKSFLVVPEQDTVIRESVMSRDLTSDAPLYFEVTNFTRFANTTFRALGGLSGEYCDKGKSALLVWCAISELSPLLTMTENRSDVSAGIVEYAMTAIKELQSAGITPEDLSVGAAAEALKADRRLESKVNDISLIYSLYKKMVREKYADVGDDCDVMIAKLQEHPEFISEHTIIIDGFTSFTEPQYKLIALLSERCNVDLYLPLPKGCDDLFEYTETKSTLASLKQYARRAGADIGISFEIDGESTHSSIREIAQGLWHKNADIANITLHSNDEIRIFEADTPFDMCDFVAQDIKRRVIDGASYSDFAIIARGAEGYRGIIDTALSDAGVPSFLSFGRDAGEFEAIKLIYTAYSATRSHYSREDVITYAKCGLVGVSREACDEFEMYVNTWRLSGGSFTNGVFWNMNPAGYSSRREKGTEELLERVNGTREKLIAPLLAFEENVRTASTVKEHAEALLDFLLKLNLEKALTERSAKLARLGQIDQARDTLRIWGLICDTLDSMVEVCGDRPADQDSFLGQFKLMISCQTIGRIPSYIDRVTVGSADMIRLRDKKHVYIIGANAGELPKAISDSSYFSEKDKELLTSIGLPMKPDAEKKGARELFIISRALCYAKETVTLLYTRTNSRFKAVEPSPIIARIGELTGSAVLPIKISSLPASQRIYSAESALRESRTDAGAEYDSVAEALRLTGHGDLLAISEGDISSGNLQLGRSICAEAYGGKMYLSQTRIDSFNSCPMAYFCKYTLGLKEEEIAQIDSSGIGTFIHAILEYFFGAVVECGKSAAELTAEERKELTLRAAKRYLASLGESPADASPLIRVKLDRLCRAAMPVVDGLCAELGESKFTPKLFELKLDERSPDCPSPLKLITDEGREINVRGTVDRVDTYEKNGKLYVRVIDYKTGSKSFSPEDISEGRNLQMFLYLASILESKKATFLHKLGADECELIPAGVLYVKTNVSDVKVDKSDDKLAINKIMYEQRREGMLLDDEDNLDAMNLRYTPLYNPKKPNEISDSKRKFLYDESGFDAILDEVKKSVGTTADKIASGDASAKPRLGEGRSLPCDWCRFSPICRASRSK